MAVLQFGAARLATPTASRVRRRLAPLDKRQLNRLPEPLRNEHDDWLRRARPGAPAPVPASTLVDKARQLALSLLSSWAEDADGTEQQLQHWRFPQLMASEATA